MTQEGLNTLGIKEIQALAKQLQIHPSYKVGGLRVRKNKAELLLDIRKHYTGDSG
ncbi:hypothetical protein [Tumebacillus permanentifrigoris]|uniref:Rho termination factor-like protein n=1 Tax=Tumebacillus permanentifrigoris TaxID=378543 RepID=A0A316D8X0_9BACL|nr:hypothetical protein [Tumebacillus permanentifrigoris]PWK11260.1 hypothetical protein C7459_11153 [Tumebacillus permanentifrigoris]